MFSEKDKAFFKIHAPSFVQFIPFVLLGFIIPVILLWLNVVDRQWFVLAPVTWLIAIGLKALPTLISLFYAPDIRIKNIYAASVWEGLLSAGAELGLTFAFFQVYFEEISVHRIFSFGLGIGFAEVLFILYLILEDIEKLTPEVEAAGKFILWPQLIERILAIGMHVFSRVVIGLTMMQGKTYFLFALPIIAFAFIDGAGGYLEKSKKLENKAVLKKFYFILFLIVLLLALVCYTLL